MTRIIIKSAEEIPLKRFGIFTIYLKCAECKEEFTQSYKGWLTRTTKLHNICGLCTLKKEVNK